MTLTEGDQIELWNREATVVKVLPTTVYVRFGKGERYTPVERSLVEDPDECSVCGAAADHIVRHNPPTGASREGYCDDHLDTGGHYSSLEGDR
jgi:hypothetical protein